MASLVVVHGLGCYTNLAARSTTYGLYMYQDYLEWKRATISPKSVHNYERWTRRFLTFVGEHEITLEQVSAFKEYLIKKEYASRNIQYGLSIVRDYVGYKVDAEGLNFPLKLFRIKNERSESHHPIAREEFDAFMALLPTDEPISLQRRVMLSLLWDTGMRVGELLRLKMSDVENNSALIWNEKNTKSRLIAWSPETDKILKKYLLLRKHINADDEWVFVSFRWRPARKMTSRHVERIVEELRKKSGTETPICPHSFRHGFTHRQLEEGKPITTIAQMLGHSTSLNVLTYAKLTGKEIKEAWGLG